MGGTTVGERVQPAVAVLVAWGRGINYILTLIYGLHMGYYII